MQLEIDRVYRAKEREKNDRAETNQTIVLFFLLDSNERVTLLVHYTHCVLLMQLKMIYLFELKSCFPFFSRSLYFECAVTATFEVVVVASFFCLFSFFCHFVSLLLVVLHSSLSRSHFVFLVRIQFSQHFGSTTCH